MCDVWSQGPESKISPLEIASAVGSSKEVVAAALKELTDRIGDVVGRKRDGLRIPIPGVGSLVFSSGAARFQFDGSLAAKGSEAPITKVITFLLLFI